MYFQFNVAYTSYPIKWNVYLLGCNETVLFRKLLQSRKPIIVSPNKSLFKGTQKECKKWIVIFNDLSITEQLDCLEANYNSSTRQKENSVGNNIRIDNSNVTRSPNPKLPKWRTKLQAKFREILRAKNSTLSFIMITRK